MADTPTSQRRRVKFERSLAFILPRSERHRYSTEPVVFQKLSFSSDAFTARFELKHFGSTQATITVPQSLTWRFGRSLAGALLHYPKLDAEQLAYLLIDLERLASKVGSKFKTEPEPQLQPQAKTGLFAKLTKFLQPSAKSKDPKSDTTCTLTLGKSHFSFTVDAEDRPIYVDEAERTFPHALVFQGIPHLEVAGRLEDLMLLSKVFLAVSAPYQPSSSRDLLEFNALKNLAAPSPYL